MDKSSVLNPSVYWLMFETVIKDFEMLVLECAEEQTDLWELIQIRLAMRDLWAQQLILQDAGHCHSNRLCFVTSRKFGFWNDECNIQLRRIVHFWAGQPNMSPEGKVGCKSLVVTHKTAVKVGDSCHLWAVLKSPLLLTFFLYLINKTH